MFHSEVAPSDGIHVIHAFVFANDAARNAASGLTAADVGKVARTTTGDQFHVLVNHSPVTWQPLFGDAITDHGQLSGLSDDDHAQYLLVSGARAMTGPLNMGAQAIANVGNVDGRDVSADGAVLDGHVGTGGTAHPVAVASGAAGFLSGSDKAKLDGIEAGANNTALASTTPAAIGVAGAIGASSTVARSDHVHAHGAQTDGTLHAVATTLVAGFLGTSDKSKLDGIQAGATNTPLSNTTPLGVGTAAAGTSASASRSDHVHAHGDQAGGSLHAVAVAGGANGFLSGTDKSKLDGIAAGATNTPLSSSAATAVGSAGAAGTSSNASRADHVHAHGAQTDPSMHALATTSAAGFMSAADKTKLDGLTPGGASSLLQTTQSAIAAATTTTSTTFVALLSASITLQAGSFLLLTFTWAASNNSANRIVSFEIQVNGTSYRQAACRVSAGNAAESGSIVGRIAVGASGLVAGANTIAIRWRTSAGTAQIDPTQTAIGREEHAALLLQEVTV